MQPVFLQCYWEAVGKWLCENPETVHFITIFLSQGSDFQHGSVVPLASHSRSQSLMLMWTNNHMVSYHYTPYRNTGLLHTSTELANVHAECMRHTTLKSVVAHYVKYDRTVLWKTKIHCSGGLGHFTTWQTTETPTALVLYPKVTGVCDRCNDTRKY